MKRSRAFVGELIERGSRDEIERKSLSFLSIPFGVIMVVSLPE